MALDENPRVLRFDGKLWVSEMPREELERQLLAQRAWDDANAKANHWALAISIGAVVGTALTLAIGYLTRMPPVVNLFVLPVGFGIGAVLGGLVNERLRPRRPADAALPARPKAAPMVKVPRRVASLTDATSTAKQIIDLSTSRRF
jgi:hypothetical protein